MHTRDGTGQLGEEFASHALAPYYLDAALDSLNIAFFLVDAELHLLHANAAALDLLRRDTTLHLQGGILLQTSSGGKSLPCMVRAVLGCAREERGQQALCLSRAARPPLLLTVAPFLTPFSMLSLLPCAIVMAGDPENHRLSRKVLGQLFDLTPAEACIAQALAHGEALGDIAATLEVSLHTVKTHLQKLFRKTGTRRQGELVAMLHGSQAAYTCSAV